MATVRKYKPKGYFRGGRVLDDMPIEGDAPAAGGFPSEILGMETELTENPALPIDGLRNNPSNAEPPADDNPLQKALDAQRHAENLQQSTLDREIGKLPLSDFKKHFLRQNPELVTDKFRSMAMSAHYQQALKDGVEDDTPEMSARVLAGVDYEIAHVRRQAIENVRMPQVEPEPDPPAPAPPEASRGTLFPPAPPPPAPPPARRRVPVSAPVSRDAPTYSGKPQSNPMTLSPEERDIAHRSYSAPDMTDAEKEYAYATNKRRLQKMRQSGEYPDRETN